MNLLEYYEFNTSNEFVNYRKRMNLSYVIVYEFENPEHIDGYTPIQSNISYYFYGYNRIIAHIVTTYNNLEYYLVERFDKKMYLCSKDGFRVTYIESVCRLKLGIIANLAIDFDKEPVQFGVTDYLAKVTKFKITQQAKIGPKSYETTDRSIRTFCRNVLEIRDLDRYIVKKINMTKGEYNGIASKLHMLGVRTYLVDLNTIAVPFSDRIEIYTMQNMKFLGDM
jgi:hypothetical protein